MALWMASTSFGKPIPNSFSSDARLQCAPQFFAKQQYSEELAKINARCVAIAEMNRKEREGRKENRQTGAGPFWKKNQAEDVRPTTDDRRPTTDDRRPVLPKKNAVRASHPNRIRKRESYFCHFPCFVPPLQLRLAASLLFGFGNG